MSGLASTMDSQKLFRLDGRVAFVSAARSHLGRAMTVALAEAGAHVIINGRDDEALAGFEGELRTKGFSAERAAFYDTPEGQSPFHYGPAKAGVIQLSRHLAGEFGMEKIRVNALVPGLFPHNPQTEVAKRLAERTMLGRTATPPEIMGPVLFLASPAARFITGSVLTVDGGWTAW